MLSPVHDLLPVLSPTRRDLQPPPDLADRLRDLVIAAGAVVGVIVGLALLRAIHELTGTPDIPRLVFGGGVILAAYGVAGGLLVAACIPAGPP